MVFGKQNTTEIIERNSSIVSRSFHLSNNERRPPPLPPSDDSLVNPDTSSTVISKLLPIQSDNMSITLSSRYDVSALNRIQTIVRDRFQ